MKKINILAIIPSLMPSVTIGIVRPLLELERRGYINFKIITSKMYKKNILNNVDLVVFCRNTEVEELQILNDLSKLKIPYIYEIDDNFFEIPLNSDLGRYHRHPLRLYTLQQFLKYASLVRVYSNLVKEDCLQYNKNVIKINSYFDDELISNIEKKEKEKIRIVYATSRVSDEQQKIFEDALYKIAIEFSDIVEIFFCGTKPLNYNLYNLKNVKYLSPIYNYKKFIRKFYKMNFDIGLAPIFSGKFYNSKTNNKYREYGGCEIAGIYSNEPLYRSCIINEKNGLLVNNVSEEWYDAIKRLIVDSRLREKIIKNAKKDVNENYTFENVVNSWLKHINSVMSHKKVKNDKCLFINRNYQYHFGIITTNIKSLQNANIVANFLRDKNILLNTPLQLKTKRLFDFYSQLQTFFNIYDNIIIFTDSEDILKFLDTFFINSSHNIIVVSSVNFMIDSFLNKKNIKILYQKESLINLYSSNSFLLEIYDNLVKNRRIKGKNLLLKNKILEKIKYNNKLYIKLIYIKAKFFTYIQIFKINYINKFLKT